MADPAHRGSYNYSSIARMIVAAVESSIPFVAQKNSRLALRTSQRYGERY
jgi:hypothetical protein